jgi:osmotically-inducible protein OsmY
MDAFMPRHLQTRRKRMNRLQNKLDMLARPLLAAVLAAASLQGCGTMAGGAPATNENRTMSAATDDSAIVARIETRLPALVDNSSHVTVTSFNRKVLLTGEVRDEEMKAALEREVGRIDGVQSVANEVEVAAASNILSRSNDALIAAKVVASLIPDRNLSVNTIKVVVERGVVYLMGRVTQGQGEIAGQIASGVSGVRKVVKVFDYTS